MAFKNYQLIDWVNDPVRTVEELQTLIVALGLTSRAQTVDGLRKALINHIGSLPMGDDAPIDPTATPAAPVAPEPEPEAPRQPMTMERLQSIIREQARMIIQEEVQGTIQEEVRNEIALLSLAAIPVPVVPEPSPETPAPTAPEPAPETPTTTVSPMGPVSMADLRRRVHEETATPTQEQPVVPVNVPPAHTREEVSMMTGTEAANWIVEGNSFTWMGKDRGGIKVPNGTTITIGDKTYTSGTRVFLKNRSVLRFV